MGNVLIELHDLSDLPTIKDVFGTLFPHTAPLRKALDEGDLWILNQRRHLLVHRRGIVDDEYLDNTKESVAIGSLLSVSPKEIENYFHVVRDAGEEIVTACSTNPP